VSQVIARSVADCDEHPVAYRAVFVLPISVHYAVNSCNVNVLSLYGVHSSECSSIVVLVS